MTLSEAIATPITIRRGGRFASRTSDLEELVTEIQSRLDEQAIDHAAQSASLMTERGRDAVEDRSFQSALANLRFQIERGGRVEQLDALSRVHRVWNRDEAAEDRFLEATLKAVGIHQVDAVSLRRLVRANAGAITRGEPVVLEAQA